ERGCGRSSPASSAKAKRSSCGEKVLMEKETRNAIQSATQKARRLLEDDFREQLEGVYDIHVDGSIAPQPGPHLSAREQRLRDRIVAAIEHKRAGGMKADQAGRDTLRDAALSTLNPFA